MNATQSMTRMPRDENTVLIRKFTRLAQVAWRTEYMCQNFGRYRTHPA